jgi:GAF domain-containing protein
MAGPNRPLLIDDLQKTPFGNLEQIVAEDLRTVVTAPLLVQDELIGCLNIYSQGSPQPFTEPERELALIFAHEAAAAIYNARLYQETLRQQTYLSALLNASRALASSSASGRQETLDLITEQAVEQVTQATGARATWATIMLYNPVLKELSFESVYPRNLAQAKPNIHWTLDRSRAPEGRVGIVGRTVLQRRVQRIPDVRHDPDYRALYPATRSELAVPMIGDGQIIGVLALESDRLDAFGSEDEHVLTGLAELATVAIQNANRADQLSRMNALAIMGAWEAEVAHDVNHRVVAIKQAVKALERDPAFNATDPQLLQEIEQAASALALPETPGSQYLIDRSVPWHDAAILDQVIQQEVDKLQRRNPTIKFQLELGCALMRVRMREPWLRRLVHHLVHNAVQAITPECAERRVTVRTICLESRVEVQVVDTGEGVDPAILPMLFKQPIVRQDKQIGRGLLLVRFMAEQHGGYARLIDGESRPGAAFAFGVPLVSPGPSAP